MQKKIVLNMNILAFVAILTTSVIIGMISYTKFYQEMEKRTQEEALLLATMLNYYGTDIFTVSNTLYFDGYESSRITLIGADGSVLYDSARYSPLNHADRAEIIQANETGVGVSSRFSDTLELRTLYCAVALKNGDYIRIAKSVDGIRPILLETLPYILLTCILVFFISWVFTKNRTKSITNPINQIDLENPRKSDVYEELTPLILRVESQNYQIHRHIEEIKRKSRELTAIMENMNEGLLILDADNQILSINAIATGIIEANGNCIGKHIEAVNRSPAVLQALSKDQKDISNSFIEKGANTYQIFVSRVVHKNVNEGYVLFMTDVTEKMESEKMRREFSANVTHELKTPLTSISGYAEIMKNGLVKPQDVQLFSGRIHHEAMRLLALIDDILKLSKLDENAEGFIWQDEDLYTLLMEINERFKMQALRKNITLTLHGRSVSVYGVRRILDEIFYNLIDNAIKYNGTDGSVDIMVDGQDQYAVVTVTDTGIGIAADQHERIFERFYRADKSHSKETGGTGLGLSIVKHGVLCHQGAIEVFSEEQKGTSITVKLPVAGDKTSP